MKELSLMSICFLPIESCSETQPFAECTGVDLSTGLDGDAVDFDCFTDAGMLKKFHRNTFD